MGTVTGKVTLRGAPLTAGVLVFASSKSGIGGSGILDDSGSYKARLPPGDYDVTLQPPPPPAPHEMAKTPFQKSNIPRKFLDAKTSGLKTTIKPGVNTADFNL